MKYLVFLLFFSFQTIQAQPNYSDYSALLKKYVSAEGRVNYKGLKANKAALDKVIAGFSAQQPSDAWRPNERLAFWINAYNAFTLKLITDNYPVTSITKLDGGKPWDVKRIKIGNATYSLNQIENEIIRPQFKDARIHFALNCAAKSCPPLLNEAFTAATLDNQLEKRTQRFIRSGSNALSPGKARISKIFEWYRNDFGDLIGFLNKFATVKLAPSAAIEFVEYDWSLNE